MRKLFAGYEGSEKLATNSISVVERALRTGFAGLGKKVIVWAYKSDYKDFIRMYVVSDYFRGMSEKDRLGEIFSILESQGAKALIPKISLCIAMTKQEYNAELDDWLDDPRKIHPGIKPRTQQRRLARAQGRN